MSFDLLRRHRRKIEIPLAIFVIVLFALAFGGAGGLDHFLAERSRTRGGAGNELDVKLLSLGRDLSSAALMADPGRSGRDDRDIEAIRQYYRSNAAGRYYLPLLVAQELGVQIGDAELREVVERSIQGLAGAQSGPIDADKYQKIMANRGLAPARYEELLRGLLAGERVAGLLSDLGTASEAELCGYYAYANQKVRVQYFQRRMADYVPVVEEASKKEAAEKPVAGAAEKPAEKPERKGVSEEDVRKRYDQDNRGIRQRGNALKNTWDPDDVQDRPEYFTEERAAVEYLVALKKDFLRGLTVSKEEVDTDYQNNKDHEYLEEPVKDQKGADQGEKPKPKPLDGKLRGEIDKKLLDRKARQAAEAALKAAVEEYNKTPKDQRPTLAALAAKHKLPPPLAAGPAPLRELESAKYLEDARPGAALAFRERDPARLEGELSTPMRLRDKDKDEEGMLALRVVSFEPVKLLEYEEAKAGVRERLVMDKALGLAKEAAAADRSLLVKGQLPAAQVRESDLLGPGGETCGQAADLAVGEASEPYAYFELLGEEAAAEKAKEKEKDKDKDKAKAKKKAKPTVAESYPKGWRVIVLAARQRPSLDDFRLDREWLTKFWHPWNPWMAMYGQQQQTPNERWRQFYFRGWELTEAKRLGLMK